MVAHELAMLESEVKVHARRWARWLALGRTVTGLPETIWMNARQIVGLAFGSRRAIVFSFSATSVGMPACLPFSISVFSTP
jgi:hypothetical protein